MAAKKADQAAWRACRRAVRVPVIAGKYPGAVDADLAPPTDEESKAHGSVEDAAEYEEARAVADE